MPTITIARNQNRRWKLDEENVEKACVELGITKPVYITTCGQASTKWGDYWGFRRSIRGGGGTSLSSPHHIIRVRPDLSPTAAGETLWHELTHAKQCEVDFKLNNSAWDQAYDDEQNGGGGRNPRASRRQSKLYDANIYEVEARENEIRNGDIPLCVPRRQYTKSNKPQAINATPKRLEAMLYLDRQQESVRLERDYAVAVAKLVKPGYVEKIVENEWVYNGSTGYDEYRAVNYWAITDLGRDWLEEVV